MVDFEIKDCYKFEDLLRIMEILRAPDGCMWDREQDHHSIRRNFIEETYEVCEAIDDEDTEHMKEELGDVLLQVVFHTPDGEGKGHIRHRRCGGRHLQKADLPSPPHIFGNVEVASSEEVLRNWDDLKRKEKHQETDTQALESVAKSLPSLIRAEKLQKKAAKVGFDWDNVKDALDKVQEELDEVRRAIDGDGDPEEEIGDLLFASVNVARHLKIDPEAAAEKTCNKFVSRFAEMERQAIAAGKKLADLSLSEPGCTVGQRKARGTRIRSKTMKKSELVTLVAEKTGFSKKDTEKTIDTVFTAIADIMAAGDELQISGFGAFETKERAARTGHNPAYRRGDQYCSGHYAGVQAGQSFEG